MFWASTAQAKSFMPVQASTFAEGLDSLYSFLVWASLISCVLVIGGMVYFAVKYRRRSESDKTAYISHNTLLEFLWSFIPFVIFMVVFGWGWYIYHHMRSAPADAFEIHVGGKQWSRDFTYKSGRKTASEFYVPVNKPVKLIMTSQDVIHSFFIPSFRTKQDVVPGRYTSLWFEATKLGTFQVFCTEYCGKDHSQMLAKIHVLSQSDFDQWLANDPYKGMSLVEIGAELYTKQGCVACHNLSAESKVGPGWAGLFGSERNLIDGTKVVADENYLRESILNPQAKKAVEFKDAVMTPYQGLLNEQQLNGLIEYIKTLK